MTPGSHPGQPAAPRRRLIWQVLLVGAAAVVLWTGARTAWRLQAAIALTRRSEPLQHSPAHPALRLLIVGDSTAVGTGASEPASSMASLLAQAFVQLQIDNRPVTAPPSPSCQPNCRGRTGSTWCW